MKSIRANPRNHAAEGDERIRTAVCAPGADAAYNALEELANMALLVVSGGDAAHLDDALEKADDVLVAAGRWRPWNKRERDG